MSVLEPPVVAVNLKAYPPAVGRRAVELAERLEKAAEGAEATVALAPQLADLAPVARAVDLPVLAQHVDPLGPGRGTGHVLAETVAEAGAVGTLLNHSERPVGFNDLAATVARCRSAGLETVVCADTVASARAAAALEPTFVAVEPPELIGGDVSVTRADPAIVEDTVEAVAQVAPEVRVLTGAGVKTGEDVARALELGTQGVLLASGVAKADDPGAALEELLSGT